MTAAGEIKGSIVSLGSQKKPSSSRGWRSSGPALPLTPAGIPEGKLEGLARSKAWANLDDQAKLELGL